MYKVIVFDLDGTLLTSEKCISKKNKKTIEEIKARKIRIVLASGRHMYDIIDYAKELHLDSSDYIIASDGVYIYDGTGNFLYLNKSLNVRDILRISNRLDLTIKVITNKGDFVFKRKKKLKQALQLIKLKTVIEKVIFWDEKISKELQDYYNVNCFDNNKTEIMNRYTNKYYALKKLMDINGFSENEVLYFGDDANDLCCFKKLRNCIAMENATKEIKYYAKKIIGNSDNDSIAYAIKDIFNLEI